MRWLKIGLLIYAIIGIAVYYLQDYILFHPEPLGKSTSYQFDQPFQELNIPYDEGSILNIIRFLPDTGAGKPPRGAILYFHGNKKNIQHYARYAGFFTERGYEVWMPDYPGFGKSTGIFSEEKLYAYAMQVYKLARGQFGADSVVIYGKSLGTGVAAELATRVACKNLILETPYYSIHSLFSRYLPIYPVSRMIKTSLPTYQYLPKVKAPVLIFHGTADNVVPYSNAEKLQPLLKPSDKFITIEKGEHNNLTGFADYTWVIDSLLIK